VIFISFPFPLRHPRALRRLPQDDGFSWGGATRYDSQVGLKEALMDVRQVLKIVAAIGTIAAGAASIVFPRSAESFTGLTAVGPRGTSEIRAVLGALFVGLGVAVLVFRSPDAYRTLGIGYAAIAAVRVVSILVDRASTSSNWISFVSEVAFAFVLVI
jgi:hypothetical protein